MTGIYFTVNISLRSDSLVADFVVYMLVGLVTLMFFFPIARLLIYHLQLISKGLTTNESLKKTFKIINNELPFEKLEYSIYR